ncbi:zinc finger protein BALDIBIS-like [Glycine soja]|uniref:Protein indeterminate-domain 9 n=1 Tax=Glycine soja TaxID=3848 RepID=A0A445I224_GLYSO|nr:zinc finger protein BALDIBIS-like [Glycine soja]KHN22055.1 Zinc finger protein JACKDAW [Glycine soja]RZB80059.1 Protein indeterminate-domain 9 [Glycine soja]
MMSEETFSVPPPNSTIRATSLVHHHAHVQPPSPSPNPNPNPNSNPAKRRRSLPGTPDPDAEVVALSPKSLMATNRFLCEICNKGFQRDQNLQLHRRGHNLPWKLKQRANKDQVRKKVYVCPEKSCVHHDPSRALGDLTGIKKHYSRKHGEKKWKCDKCSKKYAVQSDWKAHSKICGTREYKCDCGTLFSRKDSFITHRAFCDALAEESARVTTVPAALSNLRNDHHHHLTNAQASRIPQINFSGFHSSDQLFGGGSSEALLANHHHHQQQKLRLPLWLDHHQVNNNPQVLHHHTLNNFSTKPNGFTTNSGSGPNSVTDLVQTMDMFGSQTEFVNYRYPEASFGGGNANVSVLPPHELKQEQEENKEHLSHSGASYNNLYLSSSDIQNPPPHHHHYMSATTLLHKAVQMGSSRLMNDNVFGSILGTTTTNSNNNNVVVEVQKLNELVSVEAAGCTNNNLGGGYLLNDSNNSNSFVVVNGTNKGGGLEHMVMPVDEETQQASIMGKQLHSSLSSNNKNQQLGLTRDFLGVGDHNNSIDSIRRPFLQQDPVEFNAMGSASASASVMNLQSQYGGHYC